MTRLQWLTAKECNPPHRPDPFRLESIYFSIRDQGWQGPFLVGYEWFWGVQLLTGSHRYEACRLLGRRMPVRVVSYGQVFGAHIAMTYGDDSLWRSLVAGAL